jgi:hypothetical protein
VPDRPNITEVTFRSLDGLRLAGTLVAPPGELAGTAVLVHGGGVTREEGGFFTRLALGVAAANVDEVRRRLVELSRAQWERRTQSVRAS